jgi:hypothetical protein
MATKRRQEEKKTAVWCVTNPITSWTFLHHRDCASTDLPSRLAAPCEWILEHCPAAVVVSSQHRIVFLVRHPRRRPWWRTRWRWEKPWWIMCSFSTDWTAADWVYYIRLFYFQRPRPAIGGRAGPCADRTVIAAWPTIAADI